MELANNKISIVYNNPLFNDGFVIRILISKYEELQDNLISFSCSHNSSEFIPTIVAINIGWKGFLQNFSIKRILMNYL